jgi:hypothetical protein
VLEAAHNSKTTNESTNSSKQFKETVQVRPRSQCLVVLIGAGGVKLVVVVGMVLGGGGKIEDYFQRW